MSNPRTKRREIGAGMEHGLYRRCFMDNSFVAFLTPWLPLCTYCYGLQASDVVDIWGKVRIPDTLDTPIFDVVVIAEMSAGLADVARRIARKIKAGYVVSSDLGQLKFLPDYTLPSNDGSQSAYWPSYFLRLAEHLSLPVVTPHLEVFTTTLDVDRVEAVIQEQELAHGTLIAMHIGTAKYGNAVSKQWPLHKFVDLAKRLTEKNEFLRIVLTGSQSEYAEVEAVRAAINADKPYPVAVNLAGIFSLRELAARLQRMTVVIVADTGILHLAAAVGTPTVALFGPTNPHMIAPVGARHITVASELPCRPCFAYRDRSPSWKPCIHPQQLCMSAISVDQVAHSVEALLRSERNKFVALPIFQD